jgi:predicted nuclease of predicted toxin-antitoxin system
VVLRLLTDADFSGRVVRGLLRRRPDLDLVRVQDIGLRQASDPDILERAAQAGRVLLTHDVSTMRAFAYRRVELGERMPGVVVVPQTLATAHAIEDLLLLAEGSDENEYEGQILFLPL